MNNLHVFQVVAWNKHHKYLYFFFDRDIKIILLTYSGEPVEATKEAVFVPYTHEVHHSSGEEQ